MVFLLLPAQLLCRMQHCAGFISLSASQFSSQLFYLVDQLLIFCKNHLFIECLSLIPMKFLQAHFGKEPIATFYMPPEIDFRLSLLPPDSKGLVLWLTDGKVRNSHGPCLQTCRYPSSNHCFNFLRPI
jgi:hypothetical protein